MATLIQQEQYVETMYPHAEKVSRCIGFHTKTVLAHWARETGWGTSELCRMSNNHAGITYKPTFKLPTGEYRIGDREGGITVKKNRHTFCFFNTVDRFVDCYILTWMSTIYKNNMVAWASTQSPLLPVEIVKMRMTEEENCYLLGYSPWSEDRYAKPYELAGTSLLPVLQSVRKALGNFHV